MEKNSLYDMKHYQYAVQKIIKNYLELKNILNAIRNDKTIVCMKGVYDMLHTGHVYSMMAAKQLGDVLIVAVNSDIAVRKRKGSVRPVIPENDREFMIASLECVDWVTTYDASSPFNLLCEIKPDIFAASHFNSLSIEEVKQLQGLVRFEVVPKIGHLSTSIIINKILSH